MYRSVKSRSSNSRTGVSSAFRFVPELEAEPLAIDLVLMDLGGRGPADEAARSSSANCLRFFFFLLSSSVVWSVLPFFCGFLMRSRSAASSSTVSRSLRLSTTIAR